MDKNKIIEGAAKLAAKGAFDKAIKEYQRVLEVDPKDVRVLQKLGELHQKKNESEQAAEYFTKVAESYSADGFFLKAVALYKQVLKLNPNLIQVNIRLAELHQHLQLMSEAMAYYQIVAKHYERTGDSKASLDTLKKMVELEPENVASRLELAELYTRNHLQAEAMAEFKRAAEHLKRNNRIDDYLRVTERLSGLDAQNYPLIRELAEAYLNKGDQKRALAKLQICFKADSRDIDTLKLLATAFQRMGQISKAVSVLKELAKIYSEKGRNDEANQLWRQVEQLDSRDPDLAGRGQVGPRVPTGQSPAVTPGTQSAVRSAMPQARTTGVAPAVAGPSLSKLLTETDVYVKYGLHDKALEHLRKIFTVDPENLDAHEKAYNIYSASNNPAQAAEQLLNVLRLCTRRNEVQRAQPYLATMLEQNPGHPEVPAFLEVLRVGLAPQAAQAAEPVAEDAILVDSSDEEILVADPPDEPEAAEEEQAPQSSDEPEYVSDENLVPEAPAPRRSQPRDDPWYSEDQQQGDAIAVEPDEPLVQSEAEAPVRPERTRTRADSPFRPSRSQRADLDSEQATGQFFIPAASGEEQPTQVHSRPLPAQLTSSATQTRGRIPDPSATRRALAPMARPKREPAPLPFEPELRPVDEAYAQPELEPLPDYPAPGELDTVPEPPVDPDLGPDPFGLMPPGGGSYAQYEAEPQPARQPELSAGHADPDRTSGRYSESQPAYRGHRPAPAPAPAPEPEPEPEPEPQPSAPSEDYPQESAYDAWGNEVASDDQGQSAASELSGDEPQAEPASEECDEAAFFLEQGLLEEAREIIETVLIAYPGHPRANALSERLAALEAGSAGSAAAAPGFDLATELAQDAEEQPPAPSVGDYQVSVEEVFSEFKKGLEKVVKPEDVDTHYDLGIAYKEMGLLNDAIGEFNVARQGCIGKKKETDCLTMTGLLHVMQGDFASAIDRFKLALCSEHATGDAQKGLRYELGCACEAKGSPGKALFHFKIVHGLDPRYRDVANLVARLSATAKPENDPLPPGVGPAPKSPTRAPASAPKPPGAPGVKSRKIGTG